jgi:small-conductance mechanosensitive channel
MLSAQAQKDRSICLTLAVNIASTLREDRDQMEDYIEIYQRTENRLKQLNDYALKRYNDIQTSIFKNGGDNYFSILSHISRYWKEMRQTVKKKYNFNAADKSQWSVRWILVLFVSIVFYAVVAILLNQLVFRFLLPRRFRTERFMRKRTPIIMATTVITFALCMGLLTNTLDQNFFVMASDLLVEYGWLLGVILISLLLRVEATQVMSAVRIYSPLIVVGFIVIVFRIVLIPSELVNIIFPPILLLCTLWQWIVIHRHNRNIPRSDIFYSYISLTVFLCSLICSIIGYTLLSVQLLIWWLMQLTCTLTITCIGLYVKRYGERHEFSKKPVTQTWGYHLIRQVALPVLGVLSVMISVYWAAEVFNLSDLCWKLFNRNFIHLENLRVSIVKLSIVVSLWFMFRYIAKTILGLLAQHYQMQDPTTAASRQVMGKNVIQVLVWGAWLLISLSLLHISVAWLLAISGGLSTGIGFASKDIIENIYYGASLMAGRIKVGDWIEIDGTMGKVTSISYTSTIIESLYGEIITFQNSQLFTKNYKNLTRNHGYVLAVVPFGVSYGSNLKQVTTLVEDAVNNLHHKWMDPDKKVKSVVSEMADSSINFKLFVWADAPKKSYVVSDVLKCVYDTLNDHGIQIPFPQRDVHIISE